MHRLKRWSLRSRASVTYSLIKMLAIVKCKYNGPIQHTNALHTLHLPLLVVTSS